jgi:hypothetical protein
MGVLSIATLRDNFLSKNRLSTIYADSRKNGSIDRVENYFRWQGVKALDVTVPLTLLGRDDDVMVEKLIPLLARLRHADCIEQCPLSGVTQKTFAHTEFFSV